MHAHCGDDQKAGAVGQLPWVRSAEGIAGDWLCAWCLQGIAHDRDRFAIEGKDEFSFSNPDGMRFEIITFDRILGCQRSGNPTLEHTWFPGCAWCYCHCEQCASHLGWYYTGQQEFAGLMKDRLVRALHIRN